MHEVNCLVFEFITTLRKACEKTGHALFQDIALRTVVLYLKNCDDFASTEERDFLYQEMFKILRIHKGLHKNFINITLLLNGYSERFKAIDNDIASKIVMLINNECENLEELNLVCRKVIVDSTTMVTANSECDSVKSREELEKIREEKRIKSIERKMQYHRDRIKHFKEEYSDYSIELILDLWKKYGEIIVSNLWGYDFNIDCKILRIFGTQLQHFYEYEIEQGQKITYALIDEMIQKHHHANVGYFICESRIEIIVCSAHDDFMKCMMSAQNNFGDRLKAWQYILRIICHLEMDINHNDENITRNTLSSISFELEKVAWKYKNWALLVGAPCNVPNRFHTRIESKRLNIDEYTLYIDDLRQLLEMENIKKVYDYSSKLDLYSQELLKIRRILKKTDETKRLDEIIRFYFDDDYYSPNKKNFKGNEVEMLKQFLPMYEGKIVNIVESYGDFDFLKCVIYQNIILLNEYLCFNDTKEIVDIIIESNDKLFSLESIVKRRENTAELHAKVLKFNEASIQSRNRIGRILSPFSEMSARLVEYVYERETCEIYKSIDARLFKATMLTHSVFYLKVLKKIVRNFKRGLLPFCYELTSCRITSYQQDSEDDNMRTAIKGSAFLGEMIECLNILVLEMRRSGLFSDRKLSDLGELIQKAQIAKDRLSVFSKMPDTSEQNIISTVKEIGMTDIKYNICTFGSKFHIGFGQQITIKINGKEYTVKSHNTAKGRIDGMKKLYSENDIALGDKLKATYISELEEIHLEKLN